VDPTVAATTGRTGKWRCGPGDGGGGRGGSGVDSMMSKKAWEYLVASWRPSENPPIRV
jgi:hypothetical protein